jgi:hypothetical protein
MGGKKGKDKRMKQNEGQRQVTQTAAEPRRWEARITLAEEHRIVGNQTNESRIDKRGVCVSLLGFGAEIPNPGLSLALYLKINTWKC